MSDRVVIIGAGAIDGTRAAVVNRGTRSRSDAIRAITVLPLLPLDICTFSRSSLDTM